MVNLDRTWKLEKVAMKDGGRFPAITEALLKDGNITVTNGRTLCRHRVELEEGDTEGLISMEAVKAARKARSRISCNGRLDTREASFKRTELAEGDFPNADIVVKGALENIEKTGTLVLTLNAKLLLDLADAMGASGAAMGKASDRCIRLLIPTDLDGKTNLPVVVRTLEGDDGPLGIIMPLSTT